MSNVARALRVSAGVGLGVVALGCSGIWRQAVAQSFNVMTVDLERAVPASDPNRGQVQELIDDGWISAWEGRIGLTGSIAFSVQLDEAMADGEIQPGEVVLLSDSAVEFREGLPEAARRRELLLVKALKDDEERAKRGLAGGGGAEAVGSHDVPASADVASWALPDDLREAIGRAGWQVANCSDRRETGIIWAQCEATRDERHATAVVERYDSEAEANEAFPGIVGSELVGTAVIEVTVLDGPAAGSLRDALTAGRDGLGELTDRDLREGLERAGWRVSGCEAQEGPVERTASCDAERIDGAGTAVVDLIRVSGSGGIARRSIDFGVASLSAGASVLSVSVDDPAAAQELLDALLGR
jgi:hypothetical protein